MQTYDCMITNNLNPSYETLIMTFRTYENVILPKRQNDILVLNHLKSDIHYFGECKETEFPSESMNVAI